MRSTPVREFALYHLDGAGSTVSTVGPEPFSAALYSKYKYGSTVAADWFARKLATAFLDRYSQLARLPRLMVAGSAYHHVPTAANALADRFRTALNATRAPRGLVPAPLVHIERATVSPDDYGTLGAEARARLMTANTLSFHRLPPDDVDGAHLIVVDDVKVTGAHQHCLTRVGQMLPLASLTFLYLAAFSGGGAQFDPTVEDRLNHAHVQTLHDLGTIVRGTGFTWNIRVCRFLLNPAGRDHLPLFLTQMPDHVVRDLYLSSLSDGLAWMDAYRASHAIVQEELRCRDRSARDRGPRPDSGDAHVLIPVGPRDWGRKP
jgi:hypothetical protein